MQLAVLSGKGGAGKTFVAVNLAKAAGESIFLDCDVEEPNGHIFLKPQAEKTTPVSVLVPKVDQEKCDGCRKCVEFCKFNALSYVNQELLIFPLLCHSCGGCTLLCPQKALADHPREIGWILQGMAGTVDVRTGILNLGEVSGVPVIAELIAGAKGEQRVIIDCPPGSSCTVMDSIRESDYCLLVTEPTTFAIHNLKLVIELVELMDKPYAVVINKVTEEDSIAHKFCRERGIEIAGEIPYDPELAYHLSIGGLAVELPRYQKLFSELWEKMAKEGGR